MRDVRSTLLSLGGIVVLAACGVEVDDELLGTAASALAPPGYLAVTTVGGDHPRAGPGAASTATF